MCFGSSTTKTENKVSTPNPAVASAATSNLGFAQGVRDSGFTPYSGQQVADFGPLQSQSFDMGSSLGENGGAYTPEAEGLLSRYGSAPASSVSADTIASRMSPYMSSYVMQALTPQLEAQNQQFDAQRKNLNAIATSSGAFGDSRAGIEGANLTNQQDMARQGLIGSAYNSAFNTAIGAGAQDVTNSLGAQTTNAGLNEQSLARALGAAGGLENLGNYRSGITNTVNSLGQQETGKTQADLTAKYNQWLMGQQYPFQTTQLVNQTVGAGATGMPASTTTTTQQPNNSGWGLLGTLGGAALAPFTGGASLGLGSFLGGMAGGGGSGGNTATSGGGYGYAAKGGPIPSDRPTVVGEKGPELFVPDAAPGKAGTIIPHDKLKAAAKKKHKKLPPPLAMKPKEAGASGELAAALGIAA